jgi:hypothetical protein
VRAAEAYAEAAFLNGRAQDALSQLESLKMRNNLDYYQRSRVEARIAAMTPIVLELRKDGVRPADADRQQRELQPRPAVTMHFGSDSSQNCPGYNGSARTSYGRAGVGQTSYGLASLGQASFSSASDNRCNSDDDPTAVPYRW